jgi:hypothetical protein
MSTSEGTDKLHYLRAAPAGIIACPASTAPLTTNSAFKFISSDDGRSFLMQSTRTIRGAPGHVGWRKDASGKSLVYSHPTEVDPEKWGLRPCLIAAADGRCAVLAACPPRWYLLDSRGHFLSVTREGRLVMEQPATDSAGSSVISGTPATHCWSIEPLQMEP